jgi:hypothetical protein
LAKLGYTYDLQLQKDGRLFGFSREVMLPATGPVCCKVVFQRYRRQGIQFTIDLYRDRTREGRQPEDVAYEGRIHSTLQEVLVKDARLPQYKNTYFWWNIPNERDAKALQAVIADAVNAIVNYGIPWLEDESNSGALGAEHYQALTKAIEEIVAPRMREAGYELTYQPGRYTDRLPHFTKRVTEYLVARVEFLLGKLWFSPDSPPVFSVLLSRRLDPTAPAAMQNDYSQYEVAEQLNQLLVRKAYKFNIPIKPVKEVYGSFDELRDSLAYVAEVLVEHGVPWVETGRWDDWPPVTNDQYFAWRSQS